MRYKLTILNACSAAFMIGLIIYAMTNYSDLKNEDGFGMAAIYGLAGLGLMGCMMDFLLQALVKHEGTMNILGSFVAITIGMVVALS